MSEKRHHIKDFYTFRTENPTLKNSFFLLKPTSFQSTFFQIKSLWESWNTIQRKFHSTTLTFPWKIFVQTPTADLHPSRDFSFGKSEARISRHPDGPAYLRGYILILIRCRWTRSISSRSIHIAAAAFRAEYHVAVEHIWSAFMYIPPEEAHSGPRYAPRPPPPPPVSNRQWCTSAL